MGGLCEASVAERATSIERDLLEVLRRYLEEDRGLVSEIQAAVIQARGNCSVLSREVGEHVEVSELIPYYAQLEKLNKEFIRMKKLKNRMTEELKQITWRLKKEAERTGLDSRHYAIGADLSVSTALQAANERMAGIRERQAERISDVQAMMGQIERMQRALGRPTR